MKNPFFLWLIFAVLIFVPRLERLATAEPAASPESSGATITGMVLARARPDLEQALSSDLYGSRRYKLVEQIDYSKLRDFVVYIESITNAAPAKPRTVQIVQKEAVFSPHVLPVVLGTTVRWPNQDDIFHNVFSYSAAKEFDLGLYKGERGTDGKVKEVTFDKLGRVDVFCAIHSQMHCIILVLENPFFVVADISGKYAIHHVPPGTYQLKAWHERLPTVTKQIQVPESGEVKVDFTLGVAGLPKY